MLLLYNLFIQLYFLAIRLAAFWNTKAAAWINGRKDVFLHLENSLAPTERPIWVHCSSAGEFEQGKPVMEALKETFPGKKIVVSIFSPSGYNMAKGYPHADVLTYLPLDTPKNAKRFFQLVNPQLVIFVKYEFWYHHLSVAAFNHIPLLLISASFRKNQIFFKPYGGFFRQMLHLFRHIFVQDSPSLLLLQTAGIRHCSLSGDTRFDRVAKIAANATSISLIEDFVAGQKTIVAGSTWQGDEELLSTYIKHHKDVKLILAPHEMNGKHIESLLAAFDHAVLYSNIIDRQREKEVFHTQQVLIIDTMGLLSRLYRYATITYVGGGFTRDGIHNILEAATWGKPVIFGPNYQKYREAKELIDAGGGFSVGTADEIKKLADELLRNENHLQAVSLKAKNYIDENTGATQKIVQAIQEKRLLTK